MTFTEAAEAVLRKAGKPLHFKKITLFAIEQNLLSHVGKTPETTMSTRLATLTKKDRGDQNIVRVKPGVFGLREWGATAEAGADEVEGSAAEEAEVEAPVAEAPAAVERVSPKAAAPQGAPEGPGGRERREGREGREGRGRDGRGRPEGRRDGRPGTTPPAPGANAPGPRAGEAGPVLAPGAVEAPTEARGEPRGEGKRRDRDRGRGRDRGRERPAQADAETNVAPRVAEESPTVPVEAELEPVSAPAALAEASEPEGAEVSEAVAEVAEVSPSEAARLDEAAEELDHTEVTPPAPAPSAPRVFTPSAAPPPRPRREAAETTDEPVVMSADERDRSQRFAVAQEMFPEEDDDEEPLLGGDDKADGNRRRRRRRRRGRPEGEAGAEGTDVAATEVREARPDRVEVRVEPRGERTDRPEPRGDRGEFRGEPRGDRGDRGEPRGDRGDRGDRGERGERREERDRNEGSEELGRDTADIVVTLLTRRDDRQPVALRQLVDDAVRAGKLSGEVTVLVASVAAAVRVDGVRRAARGERPRMRLAAGRVGLVDWTLPPELLRAEAEALVAIERLREQARRYVVRRLNELPPSSFVEVAALLLERLGMSNLRVSRRPGLPQGEVHLSGVARRGPEELPVAVILKRGGEVGRERVIEMRGSLHHYAGAQAVWIITTGNIFSGARDEAAAAGASPVTLVDGAALGRLLDEHAVLVQHTTLALPTLDVDLYDALRSV